MKNENKKIKKCLTCPVAHNFLSEYMTFIKIYKLCSKSKENMEKHRKDLVKSIDRLSEILHIEGTYKEKTKFFINFSNPTLKTDKCYPELNQISECISSLHSLLYPLRFFYIGSDYPDEDILDTQKSTINKIRYMNDVLIENKIETEQLTTEEKEWSNDFLKTLGYNVDDPEEEQIEKAINTYNKFKNIVLNYFVEAVGKIKYKYCNPLFGNDNSLKDCREVSLKDDSTLGLRLFKLKDEYRSIAYNYLEKAPKKFNKILSRIIKYQNLKPSDIAELMSVVDENNEIVKLKQVSSVKSFIEKDNNKLSYEDKDKLKKILLASDELFKCGEGELYGNWNDFLENQKDAKVKAKFIEHYQTKGYKPTKTEIINDIRRFIEDDKRYKILYDENELFTKKYVSVYATVDDYSGDVVYNLEAMYDDLDNPKEFNTLLTVLEELQAEEQE